MNRLGHSVSYHVTEELETELVFAPESENRITPCGMKLSRFLSTGVAFDNFDRYVETMSGKDALHDTVGIAYQDVLDGHSDINDFHPDLMNTTANRRRTFEAKGLNLEPYRKNPKMDSSVFIPSDDNGRKIVPGGCTLSMLCDTMWMMTLYYHPRSTPMWIGWNARFYPTDSAIQKVLYLPQINLSPTSNTVVLETLKINLSPTSNTVVLETLKINLSPTSNTVVLKTLKINLSPTSNTVVLETLKINLSPTSNTVVLETLEINLSPTSNTIVLETLKINLSPTSNTVVLETLTIAQKIAQESNRDEISITYDLAIAKLAFKIQSEESPRFDNVFVLLGSFPIEMAFFHALGKFVEESGGSTILNECGVIANGWFFEWVSFWKALQQM